MKFIKSILFAGVAAMSIGAMAQDNNTMYLIKGDRVVGKYAVDAVDYATFKLPEGIHDEPVWVTVDNAGKNTVTYSVGTQDESINYAHGIISYYEVNYLAMDQFGDYFQNLEEADQVACLQAYLPYVGYAGFGNQTYTMTDWMSDGTGGKFTVTPGTEYYACAWEIDPNTFKPLEAFSYAKFETLAPGESSVTLTLESLGANSQGLGFSITGSDDILYVTTVYGMKEMMESYAAVFGMDFLFGTFGQSWTLSDLAGVDANGVPNATWPVSDSGEYILMVRAYDAEGNMKYASITESAEGEKGEGPTINILSRSKSQTDRTVSINFEVTPSNVSEAYVIMLPENDVDDMLNDGWALYEIASGSKATDIYDDIRSMGEYTFKADNLDDKWYSIIIYARDMDGNRTCIRPSFNIYDDTEWFDYNPVHAPAHKQALMLKNSRKNNPTIRKK